MCLVAVVMSILEANSGALEVVGRPGLVLYRK